MNMRASLLSCVAPIELGSGLRSEWAGRREVTERGNFNRSYKKKR